VYTFVMFVMEESLDIEEIVNTVSNYKDIFQKLCQKTLKCTPTYVMLSNDPKKNEIRVAVCDDSGAHLGYGVGKTRKKAEQLACQEALLKLGVSPETP
jgi:dsRNA-specific ribonuclease